MLLIILVHQWVSGYSRYSNWEKFVCFWVIKIIAHMLILICNVYKSKESYLYINLILWAIIQCNRYLYIISEYTLHVHGLQWAWLSVCNVSHTQRKILYESLIVNHLYTNLICKNHLWCTCLYENVYLMFGHTCMLVIL